MSALGQERSLSGENRASAMVRTRTVFLTLTITDDDAARHEALASARDITADLVRSGTPVLGWVVEMVDERVRVLGSVGAQDAIIQQEHRLGRQIQIRALPEIPNFFLCRQYCPDFALFRDACHKVFKYGDELINLGTLG
jgi:hypothetical protein